MKTTEQPLAALARELGLEVTGDPKEATFDLVNMKSEVAHWQEQIAQAKLEGRSVLVVRPESTGKSVVFFNNTKIGELAPGEEVELDCKIQDESAYVIKPSRTSRDWGTSQAAMASCMLIAASATPEPYFPKPWPLFFGGSRDTHFEYHGSPVFTTARQEGKSRRAKRRERARGRKH